MHTVVNRMRTLVGLLCHPCFGGDRATQLAGRVRPPHLQDPKAETPASTGGAGRPEGAICCSGRDLRRATENQGSGNRGQGSGPAPPSGTVTEGSGSGEALGCDLLFRTRFAPGDFWLRSPSRSRRNGDHSTESGGDKPQEPSGEMGRVDSAVRYPVADEICAGRLLASEPKQIETQRGTAPYWRPSPFRNERISSGSGARIRTCLPSNG